MKKSTFLLAALPVASLLATPPAASAKTYTCKAGEYGFYDPSGFPNINRVRATLPRYTDGVAHPCEVADVIAANIQYGLADTGRFPTKMFVGAGAREWEAGNWTCVYRDRTDGVATWATARCHKNGKKAYRYVTYRIYA